MDIFYVRLSVYVYADAFLSELICILCAYYGLSTCALSLFLS
jgi:hypothetical protein